MSPAMNIRRKPLPIEFWYEFGSNYSYISAMRIEEAAAEHDVTVVWQPFLLGPIFRSLGWNTSPFVLNKDKGDYVWRDMVRECAKHGLPWTRPTTFPRSALLPARVALLGAGSDWIGAYSRRIMEINFVEDRDIDDAEVVAGVLEQLDLPAAELLEQARSDAHKLRLREQSERAVARRIFGAPTFFVGDEMYWGNDRLDDALSRCIHAAG